MPTFPAVLIGGPPNSGKSILTANLTQALKLRNSQHYVLRANPDGEGDWTHWAEQELVCTILVPHPWTPTFVAQVCADLARRQLPLIVDLGGRPQAWPEPIFDHCTHAILLTPDETSRTIWLDLIRRHQVSLLADVHSARQGSAEIGALHPSIQGVLTELTWGQPIQSPVFTALVGRLSELFNYDPTELRNYHLGQAPVGLTIDLERLARTIVVEPRLAPVWQPSDPPHVLDYLPAATSLGLYGRAPNWLYAAVACLVYPASCHQLDPRLGWILARELSIRSSSGAAPLRFQTRAHSEVFEVIGRPEGYLDYSDIMNCVHHKG